MKKLTKNDGIRLAIFIQALLAMLGSLYFSNFGDPVENFQLGVFWLYGFGFDPCLLCVWARILMYPIVPISLVGFFKKAKDIHHYILPLAVPGIILETYHYALQKTQFESPFECTGANPCAALSVNYFGFITIPFLCWTAFATIILMCFFLSRKKSS